MAASHLWQLHKSIVISEEHGETFYPTLPENDIIQMVLLSFWDNIMGPKIRCLWAQEDFSECGKIMTFTQLLKSVKYALFNSLSGTIGMECVSPKLWSKLFILECENSVICSVIFPLHNKVEILYSFSLIIPFEKLTCYMNIHPTCLIWFRRLVEYLQSSSQLTDFIIKKISEALNHFCLVFDALKHKSLVHLNNEIHNLDQIFRFSESFLESAIESHLQTFGCSIIIGSQEANINLMVNLLSQFLDMKERYFCSLASCNKNWSYMPALLVQGLMKNKLGEVDINSEHFLWNKYPTTIIDVDLETVCQSKYRYERNKMTWENKDEYAKKWIEKGLLKKTRDFFDDFISDSQLVKAAVSEFKLWNQKKEVIIHSFCHQLKYRGFLLLKLYEQCLTDEDLLIHLKNSPKLLHSSVTAETSGDFKIIMAFAEKLKPGIYEILTSKQFSFLQGQ